MKLAKMLFAVLFCALAVFAQEKAAQPKPLTPQEKLDIRSAQLKQLQVQAQIQQLQAQFTAAQTDLQKAVDAVYTSRKLDQKEYTLCAGPGVGACEKAPVDDLTLQKMPETSKKDLEKKP
jgi:hypothetical protein